ncbi:MAG TPA: hypothetical protein VGJ28_19315 [Micromonosporaceae bacterium]
MAIRRAKQKQQVIEKLSQTAPPGETFLACVHVETGPSPWLNALFDEVPIVGLVMTYTRKFYFLTLTNTSIVVNTCSRYTNRPGEVVYAFPINQFPVLKVNRAAIWSSMFVQFPGQAKQTRLNIHRYWRNEFDQLIAALPQQPGIPAQGGPAAPAQAPTPQSPIQQA